MTQTTTFHAGQIVKGAVAGTFVILALRNVAGEACAQVKPVHPVTLKPGRGDLALPLSSLKEA